MSMRRAAAALVAGVLCFVACGVGAVALGTVLPRAAVQDAEGSDDGKRRQVLLLSSPIHTDFALPADPDVEARFAFLERAGLPVSNPGVSWVVAGRGGRDFYLQTPTFAEMRARPLLKGLTVDAAVLHIELAGTIPLDHPTVRVLSLDDAAFGRLLDYIEASFHEAEPDRREAIADAGYHEFDRFYDATGWFTALLGCNIWTSAGLRQAGIDTGWWTPLPAALYASLDLHNPGRTFRPASASEQ